MGKISEVFYEVIDSTSYTLNNAAEFYYHYNLLNVDPKLSEDYEKYELNQLSVRNNIIGNAFNRGEITRHPKTDTSILGISTLKNKPILVVEF